MFYHFTCCMLRVTRSMWWMHMTERCLMTQSLCTLLQPGWLPFPLLTLSSADLWRLRVPQTLLFREVTLWKVESLLIFAETGIISHKDLYISSALKSTIRQGINASVKSSVLYQCWALTHNRVLNLNLLQINEWETSNLIDNIRKRNMWNICMLLTFQLSSYTQSNDPKQYHCNSAAQKPICNELNMSQGKLMYSMD